MSLIEKYKANPGKKNNSSQSEDPGYNRSFPSALNKLFRFPKWSLILTAICQCFQSRKGAWGGSVDGNMKHPDPFP